MTRVLQLCWLWAGVMIVLKEVHIYEIDFGIMTLQQEEIDEVRRQLCATQQWTFEHVEVEWPHGSFFRPQGLSCQLHGTPQLIVSSPFGLHSANFSESHL